MRKPIGARRLPLVKIIGFGEDGVEIPHAIQQLANLAEAFAAFISLDVNHCQGFAASIAGKIKTPLDGAVTGGFAAQAKGFMDDDLTMSGQG